MTKPAARLAGFLVAALLCLLLSALFWGLLGKLEQRHCALLLKILLPWQKQELADALNLYYDRNPVIRYTYGAAVRCRPEADSIMRQFNWHYRNAVETPFSAMPDYHRMVTELYCADFPARARLAPSLNTLEMELALARKHKKIPLLTSTDAAGLGLGAFSFGLRVVLWTVNPLVGAALTLGSLAVATLSDHEKLLPGVIVFMQIRCRNCLYTAALLWLGFVLLCRPGKGGKSGKGSKSGNGARSGKGRRR